MNLISEAAARKLSKLKRPYDLMSPDEQLAYTTALRARRRAPERPIRVKAAKPLKPASKGKANAEKAKELLVEWNTAQAQEAEES